MGQSNTVIGVVLLLAATACFGQSGLVYSTGFEGAVGTEWSTSRTASSASLGTFLGRFSDNAGSSVPGSASLTIPTTAGSTYSLLFDFYALDQWDGTRTDHSNGPDYFDVRVNGQTLFHEFFCNSVPNNQLYQTYPEPVLPRVDYDGDQFQDAIYRNIAVPFSASGASTQIAFSGHLLTAYQSLDAESWGVDNVRVVAAPPVVPVDKDPAPKQIERPASGNIRVHNAGQFVNGGSIDLTKPTVVLTHGWNSNPENAFGQMADKLEDEDVGVDANIVAWDWSGDSGSGTWLALGLATSRTPDEGEELGKALIETLTANKTQAYDQPIHFIGHSLGTLVNATAANTLHNEDGGAWFGSEKTHVTLLDDAEIANASAAFSDGFSWVSPIPDSAAWIDNYISSVGGLHAEAANVILTQPMDPITFHGYPKRWYGRSIDNPTGSDMGHRWSFEGDGLNGSPSIGSAFLQTVNPLDDQLLLDQITWEEAEAIIALRDAVYRRRDLLSLAMIEGSIEAVGNVTAEVVAKVRDDAIEWTLRLILQEESPAYAWVPITVPNDAAMMSFEFLFNGVGDDDFLTVGIGDELLFAIEGQYITPDELMNSGLLDISAYAGQDVELFFGLNSDGVAGGTMTIEGIEFYAVPEPATLSLLALGGLALIRRRRK